MSLSRTERWYDIPGYKGRYQVSTRGHVRSLDRIDDGGLHRTARQRRVVVRVNGRRHVTLCKRGKPASFCVSTLMALAYGSANPRRCRYVIHRNRDNRDFRRGNLAWVTLAEQRMHDGFKFTCPYYGVTRAGYGRAGSLSWVGVVRIDGRRREIGYFATPEEAAYAYDREVKRLRLDRPLNSVRRPRSFVPKITSLPGEVWRPFPGEERRYEISNKERVRTLARRATNGQRVLPRVRKIIVNASGGRSILLLGRRYGIPKAMARAFPRLRTPASPHADP